MRTRNKLKNGLLYKKNRVVLFLNFINFILSICFRPRSKPKMIKKILLINPGHLGDMMLMSSCLESIRLRYPYARMDILTIPGSDKVAQFYSDISSIYTINHFMHNRSHQSKLIKQILFWKDYFTIFKKCRNHEYDLAINFRAFGGNLISLARLAGVKYVVSHASGGLSSFADLKVRWTEGKHEIEHYHEVLDSLDIKYDLNKKYIFNPVRTIEDRYPVEKFSPYITIHPGCGDEKKLYTLRGWEEIALQHKGKKIILCGASDYEKEVYKYLYRNKELKGQLVNLINKLSIPQLYYLYKNSILNYTLDSFSGHLSASSGAETFCLFSPYSDDSQWSPVGKNVTIKRFE